MSIDDRSRQELFQRLDEVLGPKVAEVLMAQLPPAGWADVATRHDLVALEERMSLRLDKVEERLVGRIHRELAAQSRTMIFAMMSLIFTAVLLTYTAGRFG